jgi:hypothetical protein
MNHFTGGCKKNSYVNSAVAWVVFPRKADHLQNISALSSRPKIEPKKIIRITYSVANVKRRNHE